jgi:hypothetical protein
MIVVRSCSEYVTPNTSLEPTADAVPIRMSIDSSITSSESLHRLSRLWLSLIR